jgi:Mn-dependent DtxR family transcriptional regulator
MTIWDDRILEMAREEDSVRAPTLVESGYLHISRSQISRRLRKLKDYGLLNDLGNGVYVITEEGHRYLDGELNAEELPDEAEENEDGAATA